MLNRSILLFPCASSEKLDICCRLALEREQRGEYEQACQLLEPFWDGPGRRPAVHDLEPGAAAELLMRAGNLTAALGSKRQIQGWQEKAKDLLSESAARFEQIRDLDGWGWAQKCLSVCYWREGALNEARAIATAALERIAPREDHLRASLLLVLAIIAKDEGRNEEALVFCKLAGGPTMTHLLRGHYHMTLSNVRENLNQIDLAIVEATSASQCFEQTASVFYLSSLNNLANLNRKIGNFTRAHSELDREERLARLAGDGLRLGHLQDTRALTLMDEGRYEEATVAARESVAVFERGDEAASLITSLLTLARAQANCRLTLSSLRSYLRAYELAADRMGSKRASEIGMEMLGELAGDCCLSGHVTLDAAHRELEASIIRRALAETKGNITAAGLLLGESQQAMSFMLKTRHQELRPPARKSSIIKAQAAKTIPIKSRKRV